MSARSAASWSRPAGRGRSAIAGIGVTGMLPAIVLLDGEGAVLRRSIQQNDARAVRELERFAAGMAESEFLALTGDRLQPAAGRRRS